MATPDQGGEPPVTPLDAERARLRAKGWSEEKIEQILFEREVGHTSPQPSQAAPSGPVIQGPPMSGVLGNANAVLGHVRATIPVVTGVIANLSNPAASPRSRFKSAAVLAGIGLIVCVLGFALWQEWQQHINSATEIAAAQAQKLRAEADAAKALNQAQVKKLESEAAVAKEVNEAQAEKLKAEAGAAEQVAAGAKARSCTERMELMTKNMILEDFDSSSGSLRVKPGTATARMLEKYNRECGGITGSDTSSKDVAGSDDHSMKDLGDEIGQMYLGLKKTLLEDKNVKFNNLDAAIDSACMIGVNMSERLKIKDADGKGSAQASVELFPSCTIMAALYKIASLADLPFDAPDDLSKAPDEATAKRWRSQNMVSHIKQCTAGKASYRDLLACSCIEGAKLVDSAGSFEKLCTVSAKFVEVDGPEGEKIYQGLPRLKELLAIERASKAGDYETAYMLQSQHATAVEADEIRQSGKAGKDTAGALVGVAWYALFTRKFQESLDTSNRSLALTPGDLVPTTNRAHALMFLGRTDEARAIYRAHVGEPLQGKKWETVIVGDFAKLRAAKLTDPLMTEIEAGFPPLPTPQATVAATPTPTPSYSALATPEPPPTRQARAPTMYDNYDLAGNDLGHMASDSMGACLSACRDNSSCRGVTLDKWNKVCFLKSEGRTLWCGFRRSRPCIPI